MNAVAQDPRRDEGAGRRGHSSLSFRYIALILVIVITSGTILGASVTMVSIRNAAQERQRSLEYAGSVVAASLLPVVADMDPQRVEAQLSGILATSTQHEIECIEILDMTGEVVAETQDGCTCALVEPSTGLLDVFTKPQVVIVPIEVDGMQVASVSIQFRSVGWEAAVVQPLTTTLIVLGLAMIVAGLWGGWMVLRTVVEPIEELRDTASRIASGSRDIDLKHRRDDEIGELAEALNDMTRQLSEQEAELFNSYRSLETAFDDKADLARRLERTISMKSDFVAMASHEIRSPLAVIRLYAEMLEDNEFGDLDPQLAGAIEAIADAVARLSTIVAGLLDVALLERGLMPIEVKRFDLGGVVEQAVADANVGSRPGSPSVVILGETPEVELSGDPVRLRQVVDNLISNAMKYSPGTERVTVQLTSDDVSAVLTIVDEGMGVPEERAEVLFELFGRADTADNAEVAGLGLGLPISDRIVKAHGGEITYRANPAGKGSVFEVRLPRGEESFEPPEAISVV